MAEKSRNSAKSSKEDERKKRLKSALKANLQRRKAQTRARQVKEQEND